MMSWYGVNFILGQNGKSLHSYGLSTGGLSYATGFAASRSSSWLRHLWNRSMLRPGRNANLLTVAG